MHSIASNSKRAARSSLSSRQDSALMTYHIRLGIYQLESKWPFLPSETSKIHINYWLIHLLLHPSKQNDSKTKTWMKFKPRRNKVFYRSKVHGVSDKNMKVSRTREIQSNQRCLVCVVVANSIFVEFPWCFHFQGGRINVFFFMYHRKRAPTDRWEIGEYFTFHSVITFVIPLCTYLRAPYYFYSSFWQRSAPLFSIIIHIFQTFLVSHPGCSSCDSYGCCWFAFFCVNIVYRGPFWANDLKVEMATGIVTP